RDQLLATGARIIAFGDPGQLPPEDGQPGFPQADFTLTQIQGQAAGSPIIRQAHRVLAGNDYQPDGNGFQVVLKGDRTLLRWADAVRFSRSDMRRRINKLARRVICDGKVPGRPSTDGSFDPASEHPRSLEHVIVLRDAPHYGLWNGDTERLGADVR